MALALLMYWFALILTGIATIHNQFGLAEAAFYNLGVIYGLSGKNIPDPYSTVDLYENVGSRKIRLMEHNDYVKLALNNTGRFEVSIGVRNDELPEIASSIHAAESWYELRVKPYHRGLVFDYIVVRNDAIPGPYSAYLALALEHMMEVISAFEEGTPTKRTTIVSDSILNPRFPSWVAAFKPEIKLYMEKVLKVIRRSRVQPLLMVNVFPYYDYAAGIIPKDFAVFGRQTLLLGP
ncbi:probable glucan endo-1,3-beta-glucosidase BG4 [Carya illinoinensis]|uniref:probable glucan endo-1,3-beta-glucosidase BG4 n=1 Tax=Carya illinoinensis TaxID=32201 RepID=UPI001C728F85|nr:probable glucan endo-1,3-beta-glucosidase BG4 [Carya illinoinensis]